MPRKKSKTPSFTKAELRLLAHPPSPSTWVCGQSKTVKGVKARCDNVNSGSLEKCWLCLGVRPKRPKLLWPAYTKACKKANIDPEKRSRWDPGLEERTKKREDNGGKRRKTAKRAT